MLVTEKDNGAVTSSHHYLWIGDQMVEETDATTAPSTSPPAIGSFDAVDCNQLAGWAWDPTQPNTPISVDVYDGSTRIASFLANAFRADVRATGAGNGDHAFFIPTPAALKTGAAHSVTVKIGGTATALGTRSVTCAAPSFVGFFDSANCNQLAGWAADKTSRTPASATAATASSTPRRRSTPAAPTPSRSATAGPRFLWARPRAR